MTEQLLNGKVALVTGASRGMGENDRRGIGTPRGQSRCKLRQQP